MSIIQYGWAAFVVLVLGCASCGEEARQEARRRTIPTVIVDTSTQLRLRLSPEQDTVRPNMPVRVAFLFVNGAADTSFVISPNLLRFRVIGPRGQPVPVTPDPSLDDRHFAATAMNLPHGMFAGGIVDLRCIRAPNQATAHPSNQSGCVWQHQIVEGGLYQVIAMYSTPADPRIQQPHQGRDYLRLVSDTVQVFLKTE